MAAGDSRPDPDALLATIRSDEAKSRRGRLKIFFGMCPGVGKTYAMLQAARQKQLEGIEVVAGIVETHGRKETDALLIGLPVAPRSKLEHRGVTLEELDLDALVLWHPHLVLVDELAHTNAPGSRHPKRYQDVLELLDAGIDVYTTLNVQHVESRTDSVRQITGITVRETVPDSMLDIAEQLELVDLTPEQLRQRLEEGKVYMGERAAAAADNFFRPSNLTALREMALRLVTEHVDRSLRAMQPQGLSEPLRTGDRLLVAVSASPHSAELVRWTRRYAAGLEAPWVAVAVEPPKPLGPEDEKRRTNNLTLARQLGAEVVLTTGAHVGEALLEVARRHRVTQIILGKPDGSPWHWALRGHSPVAWIIQHSGRIDVQLVRTETGAEVTGFRSQPSSSGNLGGYAAALGVTLGVTLLGLLVVDWIGYLTIALFYLLAVTIAGITLRRGPTLLLAAMSALCWNLLFVPPLYTLFIRRPQDGMMFGMLFVVALVIGHLTTRLRERERTERRRENRATALYRLTRKLAATTSHEAAVREVLAQVKETFGLNAATFLRDETGAFAGVPHPASVWALSSKEEGVAAWAFRSKRPAGTGTDTLPDSAGLHLPLLVADRIEGVLSIELPTNTPLVTEQRELLEAFAAQLAIVAEKERLSSTQRRAQIVAESERLQKTLFDSISHELKTPIATIRAALEQPEVSRHEILRANERLHRTVEHLLDATRIESGMLKLNTEWCDPLELAREAITQASTSPVQVELRAVEEELPPIRVDVGLVRQILATLLDNARTYGTSTGPITVYVRKEANSMIFEVEDHGPGLPPGAEERVFEKFYRAPGAPAGGVGLGLSIARQLAEAHGGTLTARNHPSGGARFILRLPVGGELRLPE